MHVKGYSVQVYAFDQVRELYLVTLSVTCTLYVCCLNREWGAITVYRTYRESWLQ